MTGRAIGAYVGLAAVCLTASAAPAAAQKAVPGARPVEVSAGVAWTGGESFGSSNANLMTPSGGTLALFHTSSRLASGVGFDLRLAARVTSRLWIEATGGMRHAQLETTTSGDFEGAAASTLTESTSRYSVEAGAVWCFTSRGRVQPFIRAGGGWTRELSSDGALAQNGTVANIGGGVKYWWHESGRGVFGRLGVRVDAGAVMHRGGISLSAQTRFVSPLVAGSIILGW